MIALHVSGTMPVIVLPPPGTRTRVTCMHLQSPDSGEWLPVGELHWVVPSWRWPALISLERSDPKGKKTRPDPSAGSYETPSGPLVPAPVAMCRGSHDPVDAEAMASPKPCVSIAPHLPFAADCGQPRWPSQPSQPRTVGGGNQQWALDMPRFTEWSGAVVAANTKKAPKCIRFPVQSQWHRIKLVQIVLMSL